MTRRPRKPAELPTSIRLPMDLKKRLDQVARKQGARRAHLIIHILNEWLAVEDLKYQVKAVTVESTLVDKDGNKIKGEAA